MATRLIQPNKRGVSNSRLTPAELVFCNAMQADPMMNPTRAAKVAKYKNPSQMANKLMKKPTVRAFLSKEVHQRTEKFKIKADEVLQELHHLGMARASDLYDEDGQLLALEDMPERARAAIKSFKVTRKIVDGGKGKKPTTLEITDIELHDKKGAIDMLMKHLGQYEKDNNQKPAAVFDLSALFQRPAMRDPVQDAIAAQSPITIEQEPLKKVTHDLDEFEGEEVGDDSDR